MKRVTSPTLRTSRAEPQLASGGCAGCWAAGYCAAYRPTSLQAPAACPLNAGAESSRLAGVGARA
jgi:hypothetical protein